jgi:hypothetical protein
LSGGTIPVERASSNREESVEDVLSGKTFLQFPFAERTFSLIFLTLSSQAGIV